MTKFETIGISYQMDAATKKEALRNFNHSCYCCCMRGMRIECDRCAIAVCHQHVIATFESKKEVVA